MRRYGLILRATVSSCGGLIRGGIDRRYMVTVWRPL
nr:MAG TPA: hypothetical protein [Caudoviricetes sp.]